jgi:Zn-dependent protease
VFNLIPFPPLDGWKVASWNIAVYALVMGASVIMLLTSMGILQLF